MWLGWLGLFCILEGLAAAKNWTAAHLGFAVPWDTFSRAFWDWQSVRYVGTVITLGGLFVLSVLAQHLIQRRNLEEGDRQPVSYPPVTTSTSGTAKVTYTTSGTQ